MGVWRKQSKRTEKPGPESEDFMDTKRIILSENWRFCGEKPAARPEQDLEEAWYKGYDDSDWKQVTVPHDWSVEQPFSKDYSSGTGYLAGGIGWYRVHFTLPEEYRGKCIRVVFDGIYKNSRVWCNSYHLGKRPFGYSTFSYDITHAAAFGEEENVLSVKVMHVDLADSRWFTGSGITRKVSLVIEEPVHPAEYGIVFRAESVEPDESDSQRRTGSAVIRVQHQTELTGGITVGGMAPGGAAVGEPRTGELPDKGLAGKKVKIRTVLENEQGERVLCMERYTGIGESCVMEGRLEQARLWSPEHPYLYTLRTWYAVCGSDAGKPEAEKCEGANPESQNPESKNLEGTNPESGGLEGSREAGSDEGFYMVDETVTGIRNICFDSRRGFFLNGVETKLKGVCVHHDGGALGAAMKPEIWQRRLEALKECGCNAIRCSHNPHMPELYELCDRMGFLVMDEAFDEWENAKNKWSTGHNVYPPRHEGYAEDFPQWHEADLRAMVRRDRNHPSVILWSIGNEIDYPNDPYCHPSFESMTGNNDANKPAAERRYDPNKPDARRLTVIAADLERIVRQEDDSRPVTLAAAFPELSVETGLLDGLDVAGYNYKEHLYEKDHARFPERPLLGSENGHGYQAWLAVRDNSYISGQFLWTGIDYLGEAAGWPVHGSPAGILTCAGDRKPEFYRRKSFWTEEPVLFMATRRVADGTQPWRPVSAHWNYEPGEEILVKVFSNLPRVSLYLNGLELERLDEYNGDGDYCFRVCFQPGTLTAEGFDGVRRVCSLSTAGAAEKLSCHLWRSPDVLTGGDWEEASAESGYLYQLEMELLDAGDRPVVWQDRMVTVSVDGPGQLAGLESGNLADVTPYSDNSRATFRGRLLAFIRRTGTAIGSHKIGSQAEATQIRVRISMDTGFKTEIVL